MELVQRAMEYNQRSMTNMTTSDRILASREGRTLVLKINEIYKRTKEPYLMKLMKNITLKKRKIEKRLNY
ncbi:hypothetical protein [Seonamhaeicola sp. ML3]|uniref:hypothetical protein n=1 Tax=Seonamhaeicola sp. ML3 TaxID=2937786 RepID=UPI00200F891A|nr:hypothetical protein [Seonamhaeicola sp. ML3]